MLRLRLTKKFRKDLKKAERRGLKIEKLDKIVIKLVKEEKLSWKNKDHQLTNYGDYDNVRECHIEPDWLLIYHIDHGDLSLLLLRTGSHSDLF